MAGVDKDAFRTSINTRIYVKKGALSFTATPVLTDVVGTGKVIVAINNTANRLMKASAMTGLGTTSTTQSFEYFDQEEADQEAGSPQKEEFVLTFADRHENAAGDPQKDMIDASIGDAFSIAIVEWQSDTKYRASAFSAKLSAKARTMETGGARNSRVMTFTRQTDIEEFIQA